MSAATRSSCPGALVPGYASVREDFIIADLMIGYKLVRERFTSRVRLNRADSRIDVEYAEGPFRYLENHWDFPAP